MPSTQRKTYIDALRIICITFVMFNHTPAFTMFTSARESPFYFFYMATCCVVLSAVPVFFMISGSLLLGKTEPLKVVYLKRVPRMVIALLVASAVCYCFNLCRQGTFPAQFSIYELIIGIYKNSIAAHLWFLYSYIMFLLALPLLRRMAQGIQGKEWWILACLGVFGALLPHCDFYFLGASGGSHAGQLNVWTSTNIVLYPLLGYWLGKRVDDASLNGKTFLALVAGSVACIIIVCFSTHMWCTSTDTWDAAGCQRFLNSLCILPAATMFYGMRLAFLKHDCSEWLKRIIQVGGVASFGVYLFEGIYRFATKGVYLILEPILHQYLATWVWVAAAFILGALVTLVLRRIPGVRKIL